MAKKLEIRNVLDSKDLSHIFILRFSVLVEFINLSLVLYIKEAERDNDLDVKFFYFLLTQSWMAEALSYFYDGQFRIRKFRILNKVSIHFKCKEKRCLCLNKEYFEDMQDQEVRNEAISALNFFNETKIREFWEKDLKKIRNKSMFHVDADIIKNFIKRFKDKNSLELWSYKSDKHISWTIAHTIIQNWMFKKYSEVKFGELLIDDKLFEPKMKIMGEISRNLNNIAVALALKTFPDAKTSE